VPGMLSLRAENERSLRCNRGPMHHRAGSHISIVITAAAKQSRLQVY